MYSNFSLFFTANCNMKCKYCDVNNSNIDLSIYNNKLREGISSGAFYNNIIKNFGNLQETIEEISLWGLEPTINIDLYKDIIFPLLDYYYNTKQIMFSTNAFLGYDSIEKLIEGLESYSRPIKLSLQFSLDGPKWINDFSRRQGATDRTLKMVEDTILKNQNLKNVTINMSFKPTLDCHFMNILNKDINNFYEYYDFFYNLSKHYSEINFSENIIVPQMGTPTLVIPHYHTVEDGYIFRDFLKNIQKIDPNRYNYPLFNQLIDRLNYDDNINNNLCSAGLYTAAVDFEGNIYGCHNLFSKAYNDNYKKSVVDGHTSLNNNNSKKEIQKREQLIHHYVESRQAFWDIILYQLAASGQVKKEFLHDKELKKLLYMLVTAMFCMYGHLETTNSIWIPTTSYFKLLGNGALEELIKYNDMWRKKDERN